MAAMQEPEAVAVQVVKLAPGVSGFNPDDPSKVQRWNQYPKGRPTVKRKKASTPEEKKERAREYQKAYWAKKRAAQGGGASSAGAGPGPTSEKARARAKVVRPESIGSAATLVLAGREITVMVDDDGTVRVRVGGGR